MEHRKNVLVRSGKSPFVRTSPLDALHRRTTLNNTGNLLFQHAFIRSIYQPGVASHCIQDGPFTDGDIERINAEFDAIYLPFANAFRVNYKSVLKNWGRAVRKLKIPVVIVGVGAQCESDDAVRELGPINDDVRDLCDAVLDKSSSIGVRGQFTANYLNELGVRNVDIIGCPSMFYFGAQLPRPKPVDFADPRLVAFHFSPQSPANFRSRNEHVDALFSAMLDFLGSQPDAGCTYIAQDTQELEQRVWNVKGMTLARYAPALAEIATLYPLDPHVWIQDLKSFDFALGTRIHGTIAAVLAGIPSLILCHDSRTSELADWFGLPRLDPAVNAGLPLTPQSLQEAMGLSRMHEVFPARFRDYVAFLERNGIPHAFASEAGTNPHWDAYERDIEAARLMPTLDSASRNDDLLEEKINHLYGMLAQKRARA